MNSLVYVFLQICMHAFVGELPRNRIAGLKFICISVMDIAKLSSREAVSIYTPSIMYMIVFRLFFLVVWHCASNPG